MLILTPRYVFTYVLLFQGQGTTVITLSHLCYYVSYSTALLFCAYN